MDQLSDEVLLRIARFLNVRDVMSLCCVNWRFNRISKDKSLCRVADFCKDREFGNSVMVKCMENFKTSLEVINLNDCYWLSSTAIQCSLRKCKRLKEIHLLGCNVTLKALLDILHNNPLVVSLSWSVPEIVVRDIHLRRNPMLFEDLKNALKKLNELTLRLESHGADLLAYLFSEEMSLRKLNISFLESKPFLSSTKISSSTAFSPVACAGQVAGLCRRLEAILSTAIINASKTVDMLMLMTSVDFPDKEAVGYNVHLQKLEVPGSSFLVSGAAKELVYFSSAKSPSLSVDDLLTICNRNEKLKYLNLQGCQACLGDLRGLQSIARNCRSLRQLNIANIHYHDERMLGNSLLQILARITTLESLALSGCMLATRNTGHLRNIKEVKSATGFKSSKRVSRIVTDNARHVEPSVSCDRMSSAQVMISCRSEDSGVEPVTPCDNSGMRSSLHDDYVTEFKRLSHANEITELEIISEGVCDWLLSDEELMSISQWKKLKKLTLRGVKLIGKISFVLSLAKNCSVLEYLSLSEIDQSFSTGFSSNLINAIPYLHHLQVFRLEQCHFNITPPFLASFHACKQLHSLCLISRRGRMYDGVDFFQLFTLCHKLTVLLVFCESPAVRLKKIQKVLTERFRPDRPSLWVMLLPYDGNTSDSEDTMLAIWKQVPYRIRNYLLYFKSNVACAERIIS